MWVEGSLFVVKYVVHIFTTVPGKFKGVKYVECYLWYSRTQKQVDKVGPVISGSTTVPPLAECS